MSDQMPSQRRRLLISRTDAIGDVVLTLPLATILRRHFPGATIGFLGKAYTKAVVECCSAVDEFIDVNDFLGEDVRATRARGWDAILHVFPRKDIAWKALQAGIKQRIGTSSRAYHLLTCNSLVRLSRRNSRLHEAQLNTKLLRPIGIREDYTLEELGGLFSMNTIAALPPEIRQLLHPGKRHIILHPKSQGSAREWGLKNFVSLIRLLPKDRYQVFISGTAAEGAMLEPLFDEVSLKVSDITGKMDLGTFISFINSCDALVAASTGPLHITAASGKVAVGLYPSIRPMHAGRWGPLGPKAVAFALPEDCSDCRKTPEDCVCIRSITAAGIAQYIMDVLP